MLAPRAHVLSPLLLVGLLVSSGLSCGDGGRHDGEPGRGPFSVTLVGIDGATWRVIDPLLAEGALPNLRRIVESGVRAPLRSRAPLVSPAVWTTIATGVRRERHGILNFHREGGGLAASSDRRAPALWTLASAAGLRTAVLGWWATYPAEPIDGVVVSERAFKTRDADVAEMFAQAVAPPRFDGLVHPPTAMGVVGDLLVRAAADGTASDERERQRDRMRREDSAVAESLLRLREAEGPFRLELVLLRGVDVVSHYYWKFHEPDAKVYGDDERPSAADVERLGSAVADHYRHVDELLGRIGSSAEAERVVVVASDHGFEAGRQPFARGILSGTHQSEDAEVGIFAARGGPFREGARLEEISITDVAPTLLHVLGLGVPRHLDGRVLGEALAPTWLEAHPVHFVEGVPPPSDRPALPPGDASSPGDARLEAELEALGYVE